MPYRVFVWSVAIDEDGPIGKEVLSKGALELTELNDAIWEAAERGWQIKSMLSNVVGGNIIYTILLESSKSHDK